MIDASSIEEELSHQLAALEDLEFCKARADAMLEDGYYQNAVFHYTGCLSINPKHPEVLNKRGVSLNNLERYEEAIADYTAAIALKPKLYLYYNRAVAWAGLKKFNEAIRDLMDAMALDPWNMDIVQKMIEIRLSQPPTPSYFCSRIPYF